MEIGDVVLLKDLFTPSLEWPAMYSYYEIAGSITEKYSFNNTVLVTWHNFVQHAYGDNSLILIPDDLRNAVYYDCQLDSVEVLLSKHYPIKKINVPNGDSLFFVRSAQVVEVGARLYLRPGDSPNNKSSLVKLIIPLPPQSVHQYKSIW